MHEWIYNWRGSISSYFIIIDQRVSNRLCYLPDKKANLLVHKSWGKSQESWKLIYSGNTACQDKIITTLELRIKTQAWEMCHPGNHFPSQQPPLLRLEMMEIFSIRIKDFCQDEYILIHHMHLYHVIYKDKTWLLHKSAFVVLPSGPSYSRGSLYMVFPPRDERGGGSNIIAHKPSICTAMAVSWKWRHTRWRTAKYAAF